MKTKFLGWMGVIVLGSLSFFSSGRAFAWGRHDLITQMVVGSPELETLKKFKVTPEPIEKAAPDLLKYVVPGLMRWCERYHREHDTRYGWKAPVRNPNLDDRQSLLWALEDNIDTPLKLGSEKTAADVLVDYVEEPDGDLDGGLQRSPYIERLRPSMSYFYEAGNPHTHTFRHYYVPSSVIPPIFSPKGIAPYRAGVYAELSAGAFATGHAYWGFRFLAWSIHYLQDVTQPWHTVFVPGFEFLSLSPAKMKHEISAIHFLTEAFVDTWLGTGPRPTAVSVPPEARGLSSASPWFASELTERLARSAHEKAAQVAKLGGGFFGPIVRRLGADLKVSGSDVVFGGISLPAKELDFDGDGVGATRFLQPIWSASFQLGSERDELLGELKDQIESAVEGSRFLIAHVLEDGNHASARRWD